MRLLIFPVLFISLLSCANNAKMQESNSSESQFPVTCQEAIKKTYENLDKPSVKLLSKTKKEDLVKFHIGWGTGIRNEYGLWGDTSPIRKSCAESIGEDDMHPEGASSVIMQGVWELLHGNM